MSEPSPEMAQDRTPNPSQVRQSNPWPRRESNPDRREAVKDAIKWIKQEAITLPADFLNCDHQNRAVKWLKWSTVPIRLSNMIRFLWNYVEWRRRLVNIVQEVKADASFQSEGQTISCMNLYEGIRKVQLVCGARNMQYNAILWLWDGQINTVGYLLRSKVCLMKVNYTVRWWSERNQPLIGHSIVIVLP